MKTRTFVLLALGLAGCATVPSSQPVASLAADRETCQREAEAALFLSASVAPSPAQPTYPWTAGRNAPQNEAWERLRERDIFESCMAQRGHPGAER